MSTVAFIPVRGGSKGLPGKNIKSFSGKPLVAWSIEQALASSLVDEVYVSTDSQEIADIAVQYGASVPFLRPDYLSDDASTTESAMMHFCEYLDEVALAFDNFLLMQATSPIRLAGRLDDAIRFFEKNGYDSLVTVAESHRFHWKTPKDPQASYAIMSRPRRQDIREEDISYVETGSFYLTRMSMLSKFKNRLCGSIGMYITPEFEAHEIDTELDFSICEMIFESINN